MYPHYIVEISKLHHSAGVYEKCGEKENKAMRKYYPVVPELIKWYFIFDLFHFLRQRDPWLRFCPAGAGDTHRFIGPDALPWKDACECIPRFHRYSRTGGNRR